MTSDGQPAGDRGARGADPLGMAQGVARMMVRAARGSVFVVGDQRFNPTNLEIGLVHGSTPAPRYAGGFVIERADQDDLIACLLVMVGKVPDAAMESLARREFVVTPDGVMLTWERG